MYLSWTERGSKTLFKPLADHIHKRLTFGRVAQENR